VQAENISEATRTVRPEQQLVGDSPQHLKAVALRTYSGQKGQSLSHDQIVHFLPMVHRIAHRAVTYLKPPLSFEDLISAGTVGLLKAARDFDSSHHAEFKTYAYIRIKGAVLDELRNSSMLPANVNKQVREAQQFSQKIIEQTGTAPTDEELAEKLGIPIDDVYELLENARAQHFVSLDGLGQEHHPLDDFLPAPDTTTPDKCLEQSELIDKLTEAIQQLDKRRRQIIVLYYQQQLTMKQIARVFSITESRVSQLHASALFTLSVKLRQWNDA
jgi:RNA polymerase sigma factor for flagellar operon FliA